MSNCCQIWLWGSQWISEFFASITLNPLRWWGPSLIFALPNCKAIATSPLAQDQIVPAQSTPSPTVLGDEAHVSHQELVKVLPCLPLRTWRKSCTQLMLRGALETHATMETHAMETLCFLWSGLIRKVAESSSVAAAEPLLKDSSIYHLSTF